MFWINVKFFIEADVSQALSTDCKTLFRIHLIFQQMALSFMFVLSIGTQTFTNCPRGRLRNLAVKHKGK